MLRTIAFRFMSLGLRDALRNLRFEYRLMRMHRRGVARARRFDGAKDLKLHFGCGANIKKGFVNIDTLEMADLALDLREPLPFGNDTCALVYSEHFLEHIDYPDAVAGFLLECHRVLRPGGIFSVGVPDTEWPLLEYAGVSNKGYFDLAKCHWHPTWCITEMDHINFHFRQGGEHKFAYDFKTLERTLLKAGFARVTRRECNPELDQASWAVGTLYVDAAKP
jgi:predicted SAM-dependent methyltransferase